MKFREWFQRHVLLQATQVNFPEPQESASPADAAIKPDQQYTAAYLDRADTIGPKAAHRLWLLTLAALFIFAAFILWQWPKFPATVLQHVQLYQQRWIQIIAFIGFASIYPISYVAYLGFGADVKRKRIRHEFELFGFVNREDLDETVDKLYLNAYSWSQFAGYIVVIILITVVIFYLFFARPFMGTQSATIVLVVIFGYLGAYVFSVQELVRRYNTSDLQPQVYSSILVRFLVALSLSFVLGWLLFSDNPPVSINDNQLNRAIIAAAPADVQRTADESPTNIVTSTITISPSQSAAATQVSTNSLFVPSPVNGNSAMPTWVIIVAFVIGVFPNTGIRWFTQQANRILNPPLSQASELPLRNLLGISTWHEARLATMGIDDAQNLATVDIPKLLLTTQFDTQQIVNWIDQAILYVKVGSRIDRFREAKITTFHEFLQTLDILAMLSEPATGAAAGQSTETAQWSTNLATILGLTNPDELRRLGDYSNFPNYTHIALYYDAVPRVGSRRAETSVQRLIETDVINRTSVARLQDRAQRQDLINERNRLLQQPTSRHKDPEYCIKLGEVHYKLRQLSAAKEWYTKALQLNPDVQDAHYGLAFVYMEEAEYERAIWHVTQAIGRHAADAEAYNLRGSIYILIKRYEQAMNDLDRAIQLDHRLRVAYYNRGVVHNAIGNYQKAIEDVKNAELLGYDEFGLWFVWGVALIGIDENVDAVEKLSQAIMRNPETVEQLAGSDAKLLKNNVADAYAMRGTARLNLGSSYMDEAQHDLETAVMLNGRLHQSYNRLGIIADHRGQYETAIEHFAKADELQPDNFDYIYNLGDTYFKAGNRSNALTFYRQLYAASKRQTLANEQKKKLESLARRLSLSSDRLRLLKEALELNQTIDDKVGQALSFQQLGQFYTEVGETALAIESYENALAVYTTLNDNTNQKEVEGRLADLRKSIAEAINGTGETKTPANGSAENESSDSEEAVDGKAKNKV